MGRFIGGEAECQTENDDDTPRQFIEVLFHTGSIAQEEKRGRTITAGV
jgi:hypothetical protein